MQARSLPKTFDTPETDDGRAPSDVASIPSEFSDRSDRLDALGFRIDDFRGTLGLSSRRLGMPVPGDDLDGLDKALHLLMDGGDGTCGEVYSDSGPRPRSEGGAA